MSYCVTYKLGQRLRKQFFETIKEAQEYIQALEAKGVQLIQSSPQM